MSVFVFLTDRRTNNPVLVNVDTIVFAREGPYDASQTRIYLSTRDHVDVTESLQDIRHKVLVDSFKITAGGP